ncbi:hypothetical protein SAMN03159355_02124 [Pseudomonas sp. NFPP10]|uniref:hypothetical protein n=1 Tax=unclassified Pseudomonas TaxID=196821 RepID=UPI00087F366A|nr:MULTISPECIES: hypothetical protein [unclassified Pseudomonas]SDA21117.1 hypothetical protein SAMN03159465_02592 [Pseudomonas sp. NFPP12]SEL33523.1 hypothetical protein SAMN03159355_02124 [Pseudomonas sp. NFPP10]SFI95622.1 hypothetical protein SAMN03159416_02541 [Pseudomonas sp. NFPP08]SFM63239.1 hypothetical protein SAMN03159476_02174 [Pseudomonas sp. NFPP05]SFX45590.1 hypothetical protein SAMN03159479_02124 [Pseudomonas sp. NFPP09]
MKRTILTVIAQAALALTAALALGAGPALADEPQSTPVVTPAPTLGTPGTATPTPYPQVTPPSTPKAGSSGSAPLLPPIDMPKPPKDQTLPGLEQNDSKPKVQG